MNSTILDPRELAFANVIWWHNHATELGQRRSVSFSSGEGVLFHSLSRAHHLALRRAELERLLYARTTKGA